LYCLSTVVSLMLENILSYSLNNYNNFKDLSLLDLDVIDEYSEIINRLVMTILRIHGSRIL